MKYQIINGYKNISVISFYLEIIYDAIKAKKAEVEYIQSIDYAKKENIIIVSHSLEAAKLLIHGYKNVYLWQQGIAPEESYLRNHNRFKRFIFYKLEKYVFKHVKKIIFVSKKMEEVYSHIFKKSFSKKSFIMPCFSTDQFVQGDISLKYRQNSFVYVGSTAKWQCFEQTISLFKKIKKEVPDATLKIYTFDIDGANRITEKYGVKASAIETLSNEELLNKIKDVKFGFLLRENNLVNNVATPTKLSSYLSTGVIPITTAALDDFCRISKDMKNKIIIKDLDDPDPIINACKTTIDIDELNKEYKNIFDTYYNRTLYIRSLTEFL